MTSGRPTLPYTAVPWRIGLTGLIGFFLGVAISWALKPYPAWALMALICCTGAPMWWLEIRRNGTAASKCALNTGFAATRSTSHHLERIYGLAIGAIIWLGTLQVLPLAYGPIIYGFLQAATTFWPLILGGLGLYVLRPTSNELHGLELAGRWIRRHPPGEKFPWHVLRDHLVKAFFLPLMVSFTFEWANDADPWKWLKQPNWYFASIAFLYLVDTAFATVGYLSTFQRLGAHIRSSNPYWLGWISALICYPPFFTWLQEIGFQYRDGLLWSDWLKPEQPVFYIWGGSILALTTIYALSTVAFGIRFSNLTNRGIITHGPYRWTKHPAYLTKNLSWWLISVPFISTAGLTTALLHCTILLGVNGIYWLRAITEERHLMHDPDYQAYAAWIEQYGLFARIHKAIIRT